MSETPNKERARLAVGTTTVLLSTSDEKKAKSVLHFLDVPAKMVLSLMAWPKTGSVRIC